MTARAKEAKSARGRFAFCVEIVNSARKLSADLIFRDATPARPSRSVYERHSAVR